MRRKHRTGHHSDVRATKVLEPEIYSRTYVASFKSKRFVLCKQGRHKVCRKRVTHPIINGVQQNLFCDCPCHRADLTEYEIRKSLRAESSARFRHKEHVMKIKIAKKTAKPVVSSAKTVDPERRGKKIYKYLKAPKDDVSSVQALAITYEAIKKAGTASVADLTKSAGAKIANISVIDPQTLIGVMLRKLLHRGVVAEVRS